MLVRMLRKGNPCTLLVGIWISAASMRNDMEDSLEIKNRPATQPSNSILGYTSRKMQTPVWKDTCTSVFRAALSTIAKI